MLETPDLLNQFKNSLTKDKVDIITFVEDPRYLGRKLYPRQKTLLKIIFLQELNDYDRKVIEEWRDPSGECELVPRLEERMDYLRNAGFKHFRIVQLVGGRRSSKGFVTACVTAYKLFQLTQEDDLHKELNIPKGKEIYFSVVADSLDQAKAHQFSDISDALLDCEILKERRLLGKPLAETQAVYTQSDLRRVAELRASGVKIEKEMGSLVVKAHGTNSKTIRGAASLAICFDEMAHLIAGESRMSDEELWTAATPSLIQFGDKAIIFTNSSPYQKTGKFYEIYMRMFETDPPNDPEGKILYPDHFMLKFPSWELYKDHELIDMRPQVVDPEDDPILRQEERADPEKFRVEYRAQFAEVIDAFLDPKVVDRMFDPQWNRKWLDRNLTPQAGAIGFMRYKGHGDPSDVEANFGIAVGHIEDVVNEDTDNLEPHVVFDLINAYRPEDFENHTIDWLQIVPDITHHINSFRPFEWTFDQFSSRMAIQQLEENLRNAGIGGVNIYEKWASPKVNKQRADNFKAALNLGRLHAPHPDTYNPLASWNPIELARNELKYLQLKNGKVEKQTIGPVRTKDIADCLMEVTDALIGDSISGNAYNSLSDAPQFGAQGGYGIGRGNTDNFGEFRDWYERTGPTKGGKVRPFYPERGMHKQRWR